MPGVSSELSKLPEILHGSETFDNALRHLGVYFPCCAWPVSHIHAADALLLPALLGCECTEPLIFCGFSQHSQLIWFHFRVIPLYFWLPLGTFSYFSVLLGTLLIKHLK